MALGTVTENVLHRELVELFNQLQSVVDQTQRSYQDFVGLANGAKDSELGRKLHTLLDANARQAGGTTHLRPSA